MRAKKWVYKSYEREKVRKTLRKIKNTESGRERGEGIWKMKEKEKYGERNI